MDKARESLPLRLLILHFYSQYLVSDGQLQNCKLSHNCPGPNRSEYLTAKGEVRRTEPEGRKLRLQLIGLAFPQLGFEQ